MIWTIVNKWWNKQSELATNSCFSKSNTKQFWHTTRMPKDSRKKLAIIDGEIYALLSCSGRRPKKWAYADDLVKYDVLLKEVK